MTVESDIFNALTGLVAGRVYPDIAPAGTTKPFITYQQVGGRAWAFLETGVVGRRDGRFQVNCWATTRLSAAALSRSVEDALVVSTALRAFILGAPIAVYEDDTRLYGTMQDFSISFTT